MATGTLVMKPLAAIGAMLALAALAPGSARSASHTELIYGKTVAERTCARCHQVTREQPAPPPVADARTGARVRAPSFMAIARDRRKDAIFLRSFLKLPHYPMPDQSVPSGDIPYLVEYILSLRAPGPPRR